MLVIADFILKTDDVLDYIRYKQGQGSKFASYFEEAELYNYSIQFPANSWFELSDRIRLNRLSTLSFKEIEDYMKWVEAGGIKGYSVDYNEMFLDNIIEDKEFDDTENLSENLIKYIVDKTNCKLMPTDE